MRFVIADYSSTIVKELRRAWSHLDFDLVGVKDLQQLKKALSTQADILMVDSHVKGVTAQNLSKIAGMCQCPMVILDNAASRLSSSKSLQNLSKLGFLSKPFKIEALVSLLDECWQIKVDSTPAKKAYLPPLPPPPKVKPKEDKSVQTLPKLKSKEDKSVRVGASCREQDRLSSDLQLAPYIEKAVKERIDAAVKDYVAKHFNQLAKEVLTVELRRLAQEKVQSLTL